MSGISITDVQKSTDLKNDFNQEDIIIDKDSNSSTISISAYTNINFSNKLPSLEKCTIMYIGGYLAKHYIEQFKCVFCEVNLLDQNYLI